jgi:HPt (histidine-containing phosphotransfer) domain-containing protein
MNDYISKPIDDKLLYSKIIKYLKLAGADQTALPMEGSPTTQAENCVNFNYLKRITKSDARMAEMIGLYLQEIPQLVQSMKQAIAEKDWPGLKGATHSIIPTFATMGMNPELEGMAKAIQEQADRLIATGEGAGAEAMAGLLFMFSKIEAACSLAAQELQAKLRTLAPPPALA